MRLLIILLCLMCCGCATASKSQTYVIMPQTSADLYKEMVLRAELDYYNSYFEKLSNLAKQK
jgi:hypothetical protein